MYLTEYNDKCIRACDRVKAFYAQFPSPPDTSDEEPLIPLSIAALKEQWAEKQVLAALFLEDEKKKQREEWLDTAPRTHQKPQWLVQEQRRRGKASDPSMTSIIAAVGHATAGTPPRKTNPKFTPMHSSPLSLTASVDSAESPSIFPAVSSPVTPTVDRTAVANLGAPLFPLVRSQSITTPPRALSPRVSISPVTRKIEASSSTGSSVLVSSPMEATCSETESSPKRHRMLSPKDLRKWR